MDYCLRRNQPLKRVFFVFVFFNYNGRKILVEAQVRIVPFSFLSDLLGLALSASPVFWLKVLSLDADSG